VRCWGRGIEGQLGNAANTNSATPVNTGATNVVGVAAGRNHSCNFTTTAGDAYCWGSNSDGQIGRDPTTIPSANTRQKISGLSLQVTGIAAGAATSCLINIVGSVACWGKNDVGQLGNSSMAANAFAITSVVSGTGTATGLAAHLSQFKSNHICLIMESGTARCWGNGAQYQLGYGGNTVPQRIPVNVVGFP